MPPRATLRTVLATLLLGAAGVVIAGLVIVYGGFFNVAATDPHWPPTSWVLETARTRSIQAHARGITVPPGLDDPARLPIGTEHFAAHCAVCHGAPGVPKGDIALGMNPTPPDLAGAARHYSDAELFWIIRHGIKMTGMPAWPDHSDAEIWAIVGFLKKLGAGMSAAEYGELIKANLMHGMQHHPGGEAMPGMDHGGMASPAAPAPHQH
jgi:mono/diheme cytochrome c family protein